ncbi:MAG TPA: NAD(P)/FAD-dependent oxidoreductase [Bacteroidia bacterium]|nr:NAD(P)/FAD-dependent oxidoreductase [Bacteroidia bacterium]
MAGRKKVVVVGGGFAGIELVKKLDERLFDITLIDKLNHHQFQPLFYQVATSQIEPSSISFPLRNIFKKKKNLHIRLAEVEEIIGSQKIIKSDIGNFHYDYLIIAIGCETNFYGNKELEKNCLTLKSTYDAIRIRNHILLVFEKIISASEDEKESLLNLVIVGAGPTGVELAGAFAEIKKDILPKDYPGIDFSKFRIILVEGSKNTLNNMSANASRASQKYLEDIGVEIFRETMVKNYDGETIRFHNGQEVRTKTVIWAAGVKANTIAGISSTELIAGNRIKVDRFNKVFRSENIFAIGDIAYMETPLYPKGHPQVANVAINQAVRLAKNLNFLIKGKVMKEFEYHDLGSMATVGRNKAVVDLSFIKLQGYFAWLIWMFLHLMLILSVKNKLIIFINWAWAYVTKNTSLRLILTDKKRS